MKLKTRSLVVAGVLLLSVVAHPAPAVAGTGLNRVVWGDANFTVSKTTHANSNATGFWQTIAAAFGCYGFWVDGKFENQTRDATISIQTSRLNMSGTGIVEAWTGNATYNWIVPENNARALRFEGSYAGFNFYSYFAGGASDVRIAWHLANNQWTFERPFYTDIWFQATSTRTMDSQVAC